jgi:ABC-type transport system involved in cytochrome bd biosynthesis fused ATPase/permease subunit
MKNGQSRDIDNIIVHSSFPVLVLYLVPNVAYVSGLSILHFPSSFCVLCLMLSMSLDCPFFISRPRSALGTRHRTRTGNKEWTI